jgi:hypothetical protein
VLKPYFEPGALQELQFEPRVSITQNLDLGIFILHQKQRYLIPKINVAVDFLVQNIN